MYRAYRNWTKTQFSDTEQVSFRWFRNFLVALTVTLVVNLTVTLIDLWLNLDFWHDRWGNLVGVVLIYYVSIEGYAQPQMARKLHFNPENPNAGWIVEESQNPVKIDTGTVESVSVAETNPARTTLPDLPERLAHLLTYMTTEKPHLDADLSLTGLARRLSPIRLYCRRSSIPAQGKTSTIS